MERLLTADEVGVRFRMHPDQIYYHARKGHIPCVRIGRNVRFVQSQIEEWLAKGGSLILGKTATELVCLEVCDD
jgi:excisionase family DNA binding protein